MVLNGVRVVPFFPVMCVMVSLLGMVVMAAVCGSVNGCGLVFVVGFLKEVMVDPKRDCKQQRDGKDRTRRKPLERHEPHLSLKKMNAPNSHSSAFWKAAKVWTFDGTKAIRQVNGLGDGSRGIFGEKLRAVSERIWFSSPRPWRGCVHLC